MNMGLSSSGVRVRPEAVAERGRGGPSKHRHRAGRKGSLRSGLAGIVVLAVTSFPAACDSPPQQRSISTVQPSTPFRVTAPTPDPSTAAGVAVAALTRIFTWNPATEPPGGSLMRARQWLSPRLRTMVDHPANNVETPKPSLQWSVWSARKAIIEASVFVSGEQAPENGGNSSGTAVPAVSGVVPATPVFRRMLCKVGIEQKVVFPDGHSEPLPPTTVIAAVVLTPDGWLLDNYR